MADGDGAGRHARHDDHSRRFISLLSVLLVGTVTFVAMATWVLWPTAGGTSEGSPTDPAPTSETLGTPTSLRAEYLQRLQANGVGDRFASPAAAVAYAKALCRRLDVRIEGLQNGTEVVAASVYCPEHLIKGSAFDPEVQRALRQTTATTVGYWRFDEPPGATVARDDASELDGVVGGQIKTGSSAAGRTSYRFVAVPARAGGPQPQRLVRMPAAVALRPESDDYSVSARIRTTDGDGVIISMGSPKTSGWSLTMDRGFVVCEWTGHRARATTQSVSPVSDGQWHAVRCDRVGELVALSVDGTVVDVAHRDVGRVGPSGAVVVVGGPGRCRGPARACGYYVGRIDDVRIAAG